MTMTRATISRPEMIAWPKQLNQPPLSGEDIKEALQKGTVRLTARLVYSRISNDLQEAVPIYGT